MGSYAMGSVEGEQQMQVGTTVSFQIMLMMDTLHPSQTDNSLLN